jgi:glycine/D-amino acid oxidase-like deaminating enzyme
METLRLDLKTAQIDTIIVGAGLFGRLIGKELRSRGQRVIYLDSGRPMAGSKPAACIMKPSWAASMSKKEYEDALEFLDRHYGVEQIELSVIGKAGIKADWVRPSKILGEEIPLLISAEVQRWNSFENRRVVEYFQRSTNTVGQIWGHNLILATGHWTDLCRNLSDRVYGRGGFAISGRGQLARPYLSPWAPYRQIIGFNRGPDEVWVGDGTALLPERLNERAMVEKSVNRCVDSLPKDFVRDGQMWDVLKGIRPYFKGPKAPALVKGIGPRTWVATGGAKNGTLGGAWAARQIADAIC